MLDERSFMIVGVEGGWLTQTPPMSKRIALGGAILRFIDQIK